MTFMFIISFMLVDLYLLCKMTFMFIISFMFVYLCLVYVT